MLFVSEDIGGGASIVTGGPGALRITGMVFIIICKAFSCCKIGPYAPFIGLEPVRSLDGPAHRSYLRIEKADQSIFRIKDTR